MDAVGILKRAELFRGLDEKEIVQLARLGHERSFLAGDVIFEEGDDGVAIYVVDSGRIEIYHHRGEKIEVIREVGPGATIGEFSVLLNYPRIASARALEDTMCAVFTAWSFRGLVEQSPPLALHLLRRAAQWIVDAEDREARRDS